MIEVLESRKHFINETGEAREALIDAYDDIITFIRHRSVPAVSGGWKKAGTGPEWGESVCPYCGSQVRYVSPTRLQGAFARATECHYRYCPHCGRQVL